MRTRWLSLRTVLTVETASVLDLALDEFDLCRSQVEELVDAVVDLGFGGGELLGQGLLLALLVGEIRFPLVSGLWLLEWVRLQTEARFQRVAQFVERPFPPLLSFVVEHSQRLAFAVATEGLCEPTLNSGLQFVALNSDLGALLGQTRDGFNRNTVATPTEQIGSRTFRETVLRSPATPLH